MAFFKTLTQGGQVHVHQLRMLKQIVVIGGVVSLLSGAGYFAWHSLNPGLPPSDWRQAYEVTWARFMFLSTPVEKHKALAQLYMPVYGSPYLRKCSNILADPILQKTTQRVERFVKETGLRSLAFAGWMFFAIMALWFILGHILRQAHHQRGNTLVHWRSLAFLLRRKWKVSDLGLKTRWFGKLPFVKTKETSHILMTGTTGTGKTNAFHHLLPQIRKRGDRAVVVDVTGDYVSRYYEEGRDVLLNPLDTRSRPWTPWADCHLDSHYDVLAESFIQSKEGTKDPFWDNASRAVFKTTLRKYAALRKEDVEGMYTFLMSSTDKEFEDFFKGTEAATFAFKNNEKTTHSIRSVLSSQIECLRQLEPTDTPFSIRNWVMTPHHPPSRIALWRDVMPKLCNSEGGWLFITARPDQRETLRPLISAWMDISLNALMVLPEDQKRRLWFVIDELASLQRLPRLQAGLAEGRKYGGCLLVGFQSKPQLEEIYGRNAAEAMLDLFNTKIFFRCTEPSTQQWISKVLGDKEETEPTENISYGANSMRDGVSLSHHTRQTPLVMPAELSQLKDLECYLKFPGDLPCTRIQSRYQKPPLLKQEPFRLKPEKQRIYSLESPENRPDETQEVS